MYKSILIGSILCTGLVFVISEIYETRKDKKTINEALKTLEEGNKEVQDVLDKLNNTWYGEA